MLRISLSQNLLFVRCEIDSVILSSMTRSEKEFAGAPPADTRGRPKLSTLKLPIRFTAELQKERERRKKSLNKNQESQSIFISEEEALQLLDQAINFPENFEMAYLFQKSMSSLMTFLASSWTLSIKSWSKDVIAKSTHFLPQTRGSILYKSHIKSQSNPNLFSG